MKAQLEETFEDHPEKAPTSASAKARFASLSWKSSVDLPNAAQLNPEVNRFPKATDVPVRALSTITTTKERTTKPKTTTKRGGGGKEEKVTDVFEADPTSLLPGIKRQRTLKISDNYKIIEDPANGMVHVIEMGERAGKPSSSSSASAEPTADPPAEEDEDDDDEE